jgi:hypothetical protein
VLNGRGFEVICEAFLSVSASNLTCEVPKICSKRRQQKEIKGFNYKKYYFSKKFKKKYIIIIFFIFFYINL